MDQPTRRASYAITTCLVGLSLLLWLFLLAQLIFVVPAFERQWANAGMRLPYLTEVLIGVTRFTFMYWYIVIPYLVMPAFLGVGLVSYLLRHLVRTRVWGTAWFVLSIGLSVAANGMLWIVLLLP